MIWLNLTPNTPAKIKKIIMTSNFQEHNFFLLMKRADRREKTSDPGKEIPIYSVVQSTYSVTHKVCQISGR
jgi:hypothetical protein